MKYPFDVEVTSHQFAEQTKHLVSIGHHFVFVQDGAAIHRGGRMGRLLGHQGQNQRVTVPLIEQAVELAGVRITPKMPELVPLGCLVADRDLYRAEQDTVNLFVAMPGSHRKATLVVHLGQQEFLKREVDLDRSGTTIERLSMLLPGEYRAHLEVNGQAIGTPARFTVAEYTLAPLTARMTAHQLRAGGRALAFELDVSSYQVAFNQTLRVSILDGQTVYETKTVHPASPGRYADLLPMPGGEGPFRLRLEAEQDANRIAEVPIPGSRKREREVTVVSELGKEVLLSLMPERGALAVRGAYLTEGDHFATPLTVDELIGDVGRIQVRADVEDLRLIVADLGAGTLKPMECGSRTAGETVEVPLDGPLCTVFVGAFVGGHPFEGYTSFLRRSRVSIGVEVPEAVRPTDEVMVKLTCEGDAPVPVLLSVRDERLTATDTPQVALAASSKEVFQSLANTFDDEHAFVDLADAMPKPEPYRRGPPPPSASFGAVPRSVPAMSRPPAPAVGRARRAPEHAAPQDNLLSRPLSEIVDPEGDWDEPTGRSMVNELEAFPRSDSSASPLESDEFEDGYAQASGSGVWMAGMMDDVDPTMDVPVGAPPSAAAGGMATPEPRSVFPEVLFFDVVEVSGERIVRVPVGEALSTYRVDAFAMLDADWAETRVSFDVDQPVRIDLELPAAVHLEDRVDASLRIATASGRARVSVTRDGEPIRLLAGGQDISAQAVLPTPAQLVFPVRPGRYLATVEDAETGESDSVEKTVDEPGRFKSYVCEIGIMESGGRLTLEGERALAMRVLPSLDEPFKVLTHATAGYGHLCCEQTAAKILSAVTMYLTSDDEVTRRKAESIIEAGISREKTMYLPGRGFAMYPEYRRVDSYWGPQCVQHLWSLRSMEDVSGLSPSLRRAVREGLDMADDAGRGHGLSPSTLR